MTTRLSSVLAVVRAYATHGAIIGALVVSVDWMARGAQPWRWLFAALGLGGTAGALALGTLSLALVLLGILPFTWLRLLLVTLACSMGAFVITHELGVVERLSGPHAAWAWLGMVAALLSMALAGALFVGLTPELRNGQGDGRTLYGAALGRSIRWRRALGVVLLVGSLLCIAVDALVLVGHYPFAHELLRRGAVILGAIALLTLGRALPAFETVALSCLVLGFAALMVLGPERAQVVSALRAAPFPELAIDDLRGLADTDLDGFSGWLAGGDCAPFDAAVHPDAQELPGNGKDDNCRLGDLAQLPERPVPVVHASAAPVSLVLITIDTLRADHVGAYGYERQTTPNIDAFFAPGLRCANAIAAGAYTTISMPALMRGYYARHLHWEVGRQTDHFRLLPASGSLRQGEGWFRAHLLAFDPEHRPLAALLLPLGFHTWAVVDDGGWGFLSRPLMGQGFEQFRYVPSLSGNMWAPEGDAHVARASLEALQAREQRPFFLWVHFIGVHAPDAKHEDVPIFGTDAVAAYDHEIARVDRELAPVLRALAAIERERPLVTMLTADHGEEFFSQGRAHGSSLSESEIRVPLLMRGAGVPQRLVREPVSLVDVAPTLLARAGVSEGAGFDGLDILDGRKLGARQAVLSDVWRYDARGVLEFDRVAAVGERHRLVFEAARNSTRLYHRGEEGALVFSQDAVLEDAAARYLEVTGPRPSALLP